MSKLAVVVVVLVVSSATLLGMFQDKPGPSASAAGPFALTFNGNPSSPLKYADSGVDIQVHPAEDNNVMRQEAHHGSDCSPYPATHTITDRLQAVFVCKDHLMTAIGAGYGLIYITPNQLVDFSNGEAVIQFDSSTFRSSDRDWIDLWVTPYEDNLARPLDDIYPPLQGEPERAVHFRMDNASDGSGARFSGFVVRDFEQIPMDGPEWQGYKSWLDVSATRRDTFELRISRTHIKFGMPAYDRWWVDDSIADLGWSSGVVQIGHHSYNPDKGSCLDACGPNTWHWDNLEISPAIPFTMIQADSRGVYENGDTITFDAPAPKDAHLRFAGLGRVEISLDGKAYQPAVLAAQERHSPEHYSSYWTPIPAGTRTVAFRFSQDDWYQGPHGAQDFTIWSKSSSSQAPGPILLPTNTPTRTPTNTPVATATRTNTAVPTATPTRTATSSALTATLTRTPTNTPVAATATPTRTATNTPAAATATPTRTATNTPVASTATPTRTPTNTPLASTATPIRTNTPVVTSTSTRTPTVTPSPTPTQSLAATFSSIGSILPLKATAGRPLIVLGRFTSSKTMTALLDFEIYDSSGRRIYQRAFDRRSLSAGRVSTTIFTWSIPANTPPGTYTVKLGVFSAGWGTLLHWNDRAATFTIAAKTTAAIPGNPAAGFGLNSQSASSTDHLASFGQPQFIANPSWSSSTAWYCGQEPESDSISDPRLPSEPKPLVLDLR